MCVCTCVCIKEKGGKRNTLFIWHLFRNTDIIDVLVADLLCKNVSETEKGREGAGHMGEELDGTV